MRRDKPRPRTLRLLLAEIYTASASDLPNNRQNGDIGYFRQPGRGRPLCRGLAAKPTEAKNLFTMSKIKAWDPTGAFGQCLSFERPGSASGLTGHKARITVEAIGIEPPAAGRRDFIY